MDYFRASVSDWTFEWEDGTEQITHITQEVILRYPTGEVKVVLNNASVSSNICNALVNGKLENLKLVHEFYAIPTSNTDERIPMREILQKVRVSRIAEVAKPMCLPQMIIYAESRI